MNEVEMQLQKRFNLAEVLRAKLMYSDILAMNWIVENINNGRLQSEKLDKTYYLISYSKMVEDINDPNMVNKDTITTRMKNLHKRGYIELVSGSFMSKEFGLCKILVKMGKNFKTITNE